MPAPVFVGLGALLVELGELAGLARFAWFVRSSAWISTISIRFSKFFAWFKNAMSSRAGVVFTVVVTWLGSHFDEGVEWFEEKWDEYNGDVRAIVYESANNAINAGIEEAMSARYPQSWLDGVAASDVDFVPFNNQSLQSVLVIGLRLAFLELWFRTGKPKPLGLDTIVDANSFASYVQREVMAEITNGGGVFIKATDIASLKLALNRIKDNDLVQAYGVYAGTGLQVSQQQVVDVKLARKRAQGRARQREYMRTHKRDYTWIPK